MDVWTCGHSSADVVSASALGCSISSSSLAAPSGVDERHTVFGCGDASLLLRCCFLSGRLPFVGSDSYYDPCQAELQGVDS